MQTQLQTPVYPLSHITDLASLDEAALAQFSNELPTLVAFLKLTKQVCEKDGKDIKDVLPVVQFIVDGQDEVTVRQNGDGITLEGGWIRRTIARQLNQFQLLCKR